jgi:hypothetical protein
LPLRRLTREQYENTVRDLLGIDIRSSDAIAPDEKAGPFAANVATPVSRLLVDEYEQMAEQLATTAVTGIDALVNCNRAAMGDAPCASNFIAAFGLRAYRRPLAADEQTRFETLEQGGAMRGGFAHGIQLVIQTMLQSPNFLYHQEFGIPQAAASAAIPLGAYEVASRLSYFLWNTTPDSALLDAARTGALDTEAGLLAQAERLLGGPHAPDAISSFHLQWLNLSDKLDDLQKDPAVYPTFNPAMVDAMRNETTMFADYVIRQGDGRLETLLTAPFSFVTSPLRSLYGLPTGAQADSSRPVNLDPTQRAGLLTQAAFLASQAHPDQSSPVQRGVTIRRNVLCEALPDPPPNVNPTPPALDPNATTRQRFAQHTADASCAGCHALIDGIGLGFENYDGIGAFRSTENGLPIDASGQVVATSDINGGFVGAVELAGKLAHSAEVQDCVSRQWFRFAMGRLETPGDTCSLTAASTAFKSSDFNVKNLLLAVVSTDAFRFRSDP